jgi:hypothetical protein
MAHNIAKDYLHFDIFMGQLFPTPVIEKANISSKLMPRK